MSGHSKWKKIKRQKMAGDIKKGNLFTKLSQAITTAVRQGGGGDPDMNYLLRIAIENAKASNMPKDNIERAINKGVGERDSGKFEAVSYEIVGEKGIGLIVDCVTDNRNRVVSEIRRMISDTNFSIEAGVAWQFNEYGLIVIESKEKEIKIVKGREEVVYKDINKDDLIIKILEIDGVVDIEEKGDKLEITTDKNKMQTVFHELEKMNLKINQIKVQKKAKNKINIDDKEREKVKEVIGKLEEIEDVVDIWSNIS